MKRLPILFLAVSVLAGTLLAAIQWLEAEETTTVPKGVSGSLEVRYARAYLQLAEADLQSALEVNREVPDAIPNSVITPLRHVVSIAKAQLEYALHADPHGLHNVHIRHAVMAAEDAESDLHRTLAVNRNMPELASPLELRRARLRLEVAKLGLEIARQVDVDNTLEHVQWQLEEMRKELLQLRSQVERLSL